MKPGSEYRRFKPTRAWANTLPCLMAALSLFAFLSLFSACAAQRTLSPVSAGTLAARMANDRCEKAYGERPFASEDFDVVLADGRWHWGTAENDGKPSGKVDGYEVDVSFDRNGGKERVSVRIPEE